MQVYVTERGIRNRKRTYSRVAGLSRKEAHYLKRKGTLKVSRETAEILIERGWASADSQHPQVAKNFPVNDEPIPVTTQEVTPEETAEVQIEIPGETETEALGSDEAEDSAEMSDDQPDSSESGSDEEDDEKPKAASEGADYAANFKKGADKGGQ